MVEGKRVLFVGGNWKSNGNTAMVKDLCNNLINKIQFEQAKCGKLSIYYILLLTFAFANMSIYFFF